MAGLVRGCIATNLAASFLSLFSFPPGSGLVSLHVLCFFVKLSKVMEAPLRTPLHLGIILITWILIVIRIHKHRYWEIECIALISGTPLLTSLCFAQIKRVQVQSKYGKGCPEEFSHSMNLVYQKGSTCTSIFVLVDYRTSEFISDNSVPASRVSEVPPHVRIRSSVFKACNVSPKGLS